MRAVEFVRRVPDSQRETFIERVRNDRSLTVKGYPNYDIRPAGRREEYWTVEYLEPLAGNEPAFGLDLQKRVHEDMARAFSAYPRTWGLRRPDRNIDHRRVLNLETYFRRKGAALRYAGPADFQPGDMATQRLPGNLPHIVIVGSRRAPSGRYYCVHNVGRGAQVEDVLAEWPLAGRFRFAPV